MRTIDHLQKKVKKITFISSTLGFIHFLACTMYQELFQELKQTFRVYVCVYVCVSNTSNGNSRSYINLLLRLLLNNHRDGSLKGERDNKNVNNTVCQKVIRAMKKHKVRSLYCMQFQGVPFTFYFMRISFPVNSAT